MYHFRRFATLNFISESQRSKAIIEKFLNSKPTTNSLRSALLACSYLEARNKSDRGGNVKYASETKDVMAAKEYLPRILQKYDQSPTTRITNQTLFEYFTNRYPPTTESVIQVLRKFSSKSHLNVVPEQIGMIPLRRAVYQADFPGALEVIRLTCGDESNYGAYMGYKLKKFCTRWVLGMGVILTGVYSVLNSCIFGSWDTKTSLMICLMFGTYLSAVTVFGMLTLSGSKSGLGNVLQWIPGMTPVYRYKYRDRVKMATFVTELNRSLPENLGDCSTQLLHDLQEMKLKPVETQNEAYLKEFWARGGSGFYWTEPDQDPAYVLWTKYMDANQKQRIGSPYSRKDSDGKLLRWMSEVEKEQQGQSFPHASLLGVEKLQSKEDISCFEEELRNDMKEIRALKKLEQIGDGSADIKKI